MVYGGIYFWLFLSLLAEIAADYYLKLWRVKSENIQLAIGIFLYALATLFFAFSMKGGGIMIGLGVYVYTDTLEVIHMVHRGLSLSTQQSMLILLELVDMAMIANLVKMVITGSYTSFVSKNHKENTERVSSGLLKVKMSTSLVGVSSFHLLQIFIEAKTISWANMGTWLMV